MKQLQGNGCTSVYWFATLDCVEDDAAAAELVFHSSQLFDVELTGSLD